MFPLLVSTTFVGLHTGHSVTLAAYLFRVLVFLLAFAGIAVTLFWAIRMAAVVHSAVGRHRKRNQHES